MKCSLDAAHLTPDKQKRLKTLMALLAKAKAFQNASVRVVHHYTQQEWEQDFTFASLACGKRSYMRGRGGSIQRGDQIVLQNGAHTVRYHVDEIDYEPTPARFWIALLQPCSELVVDRRFWMQPVDEACRSSI
ncbi:MAG: hypothetical protein KME45_12350 [Stenomitos rutilans HA7619-LM2]|jgi:hypothetical protein|nr:hypothetical protein [Stenomitos rutilans HA7619-LM2]